MTVLLTRRAVLQVAMETTYNVAAAVGANDGVLVEAPNYDGTPSVLVRNFTRDTLSPQASITGRITAKMDFTTELRGNGAQNAGTLASAPIITRLFRACGYQLIPNTSPTVLGPYDVDTHVNEVAWGLGSGAIATNTLVFSTAPPANNDTVTLNGQVYTFVTVLSGAAYEVLIGATFSASADNLVSAINHTSGEGLLYGTGTPVNIYFNASNATGTVTLTADQPGTSGNALTTTASSTHITATGATLTGGTNVATTTDVVAYYLTCTTPGASGVAAVTVSSDTIGEAIASAVVTSGTAFTIGTKGLTLKPTFTGNLASGQKWVVWLTPAGLRLKPISDNFESATLVMHKDRVKHTMPGAFGTFDIDATAGQFATVKWTFTGTYVSPVDDPLPSPVYEKTLPAQVELARLRTNSFNAIVNKMTFSQTNDVQIRPDVSSAQGYIGSRIVSRTPVGGIDPEADLVGNYDFWGSLSAGTRIPFQMRVGKVAGNIIWMFAPSTQYSKMTYADRNGIETYAAGLNFSGYQADDEVQWLFM